MQMKKGNHKFVFYTIKVTKLKRFLLLDMVAGTGIYFTVKVVTASVVAGMVGSVIGTEGIKRWPRKE
ncbi:hypothetical protein ACE1TH_11970 [Shouchella sp. JSM 1781072]|uniref:hypothetical protein n=1 Tax=Bacillaceae TaxID=186817 RepID=UPI0020D196FA|nr:hypothetical protein [Alkalihalobacillus sp. LMS6]UTR06955.1 hypothetical protein MM326_02680 [Alkalihalobacillus sp. LMS6]